MKLIITEKQFKILMSKKTDMNEEDTESTDSTPKNNVEKWESGVTRGPSNQIGLTKWSDVVGSNITRGPSNQIGLTKWSDVVGSKITRGKANKLK